MKKLLKELYTNLYCLLPVPSRVKNVVFKQLEGEIEIRENIIESLENLVSSQRLLLSAFEEEDDEFERIMNNNDITRH